MNVICLMLCEDDMYVYIGFYSLHPSWPPTTRFVVLGVPFFRGRYSTVIGSGARRRFSSTWVPVKTAPLLWKKIHQLKKPHPRNVQSSWLEKNVFSCTFLCFPGSIEIWRGESDFFPKSTRQGFGPTFPSVGSFLGVLCLGHPEAYIISFTFLNLIQAVLVHSTSVRNQRSKTVKSPPPPAAKTGWWEM